MSSRGSELQASLRRSRLPPPRGLRTTTRSGRRSLPASRATRLTGVAPEKAFARLSSLLMRRGYSPEIARSAARKALEIAFQDE